MDSLSRFTGVIPYLVIPGLFLILSHLWDLRGGGNKGLYMATHIYAGRAYVGIPFGITCLFWALAAIPDSQTLSWIFLGIGLVFFVLGVIFAGTQPSFLKPAWLRWLEQEHADIMPLLIREANEMGLGNWEQWVKSQADLEAWVAKVRQRYGR